MYFEKVISCQLSVISKSKKRNMRQVFFKYDNVVTTSWQGRGVGILPTRRMGVSPMFLFFCFFCFLCHSRAGGNPVFSFFCHSPARWNPGKFKYWLQFPLDSRFRGNDTWGTLGIGYSMGVGYWLFNGHWVFGPWPFFRYSLFVIDSAFGFRRLLFFPIAYLPTCLLPTCLLPTCLLAYLPICLFPNREFMDCRVGVVLAWS